MAPSLQNFETSYLALSQHLKYIFKESSWAEYILFHLVIGLLGLAINAFMGSQKRGTYYLRPSAIAGKQMKESKEGKKVGERRRRRITMDQGRSLEERIMIKNEVATQFHEVKTAEIWKELCAVARAMNRQREVHDMVRTGRRGNSTRTL